MSQRVTIRNISKNSILPSFHSAFAWLCYYLLITSPIYIKDRMLFTRKHILMYLHKLCIIRKPIFYSGNTAYWKETLHQNRQGQM